MDDLDDIPDPVDRQGVLAAVRPRGRGYWTETLPMPTDFPDAPVVYLQTSAAYLEAVRAGCRARMGHPSPSSLGHFPGFTDPEATASALLELLEPLVPGLLAPVS